MDVDKILLDFAETEDDLDIPLTNYSPGQADSLLNSLASAFSMKGTSSSLPGMKMQMNHPQSMLQMVRVSAYFLLVFWRDCMHRLKHERGDFWVSEIKTWRHLYKWSEDYDSHRDLGQTLHSARIQQHRQTQKWPVQWQNLEWAPHTVLLAQWKCDL